ncbi:hypothetical protein ACS8YF_18375 [Salinisphaera sp. SWV1]|uniref:hypothetical protein n=1 Tax=Salinisphaera sp. SWV1 TaxID=3454139 RepID=UPI003F861900
MANRNHGIPDDKRMNLLSRENDYRETCHRVACVLLAMDQDPSGDAMSDDVRYGYSLIVQLCVEALESTAGNRGSME